MMKAISQESNITNAVFPDSEDKKYMNGLRSAVLKHMERNIAKGRKDKYYGEEDEIFYSYVESIMFSPTAGKWHFIKEDIPGYPFSPVYGTVFIFEYEGETTFYGWNEGRYEIGFYTLPDHLDISREEFIRMEDLLNEPIGIAKI